MSLFIIITKMQRVNSNIQLLQSTDCSSGLDARPTVRASVSVDLDNEWAYLKTQGVGDWTSFPSYLDRVVPRMLGEFKAAGLNITFFVVGKDAVLPENAHALRQIADAGHEVANHSFMHEPWLHLYSREELERDFEKSEAAILKATGCRPAGFRGPGFSSSPLVRQMLLERGYTYDASLFPTTLGPVARAYFRLKSQLSDDEKKKRSGLYGSLSDAYCTLRPFEIEPGLMEVPVTTMPIVRFPVHLSYLLFLAQYSEALARLYWQMAVTLCRLSHIGPSLLLHPTDFLDAKDAPGMNFFPAMKIPAQRKIALVRFALDTLKENWATGTVAAHARAGALHTKSSSILQPSHQTLA